ncbi:AAA family ATPase [uncultured Sphaerochaeta sp.]|uniref:AAA family ATPase n=1 Tax=uncultured Sphaerochaeta sp. TaxID=886478 RepID=UPI002A0A81E1|nr:AAA family ATPase [uncultured Sphaerochaeta sp.]
MILEMRLSNFYSIKDEICIDFRAGKINTESSRRLSSNVFKWKGEVVLKSLGLFGANASGKSNIFKAISFCSGIVLESHMYNENTMFNFEPFKFDGSSTAPSTFFIDFVFEDIEYEYAFALTKDAILKESLHYYPKGKKAKVFIRDEQAKGDKVQKYSFSEGVIPKPLDVAQSTSEKTLYISRGSQMDRGICKTVFRFFMNQMILGLAPDSSEASRNLFEKNRELIKYALKICDSDILDIKVLKEQVLVTGPSLPRSPGPGAVAAASMEIRKEDRVRFVTYHNHAPAIPFDLQTEESTGTYRLFHILLSLIDVVLNGKTFLLDEFDASLHSIMASFILDLFHASTSAQFLFASHDTNLIDMNTLRRDQILFVRKKEDGSTDVYSLYDYKDFRENMDAEKGYLQGRFDAVPIIGSSMETLQKLLSMGKDGQHE